VGVSDEVAHAVCDMAETIADAPRHQPLLLIDPLTLALSPEGRGSMAGYLPAALASSNTMRKNAPSQVGV
jgi:hypothetical protein